MEDRSRRYPLTEELEFPEVFQSDLTDLLDLLVLMSRDYLSPDTSYTRAPLPEFIERVGRLLTAESSKWPRDTRASLMFAFADLCLVYGVKDWRNDEWLKKAQAAYRAGFPKPDEDWIPRGHVNALFNFAMTHSLRGVCLPDRTQLEQSIPLFHRVAYLCSGGRDSWLYAYANMQLGHVLRQLGEEESGTARLEEALAAYMSAAYEVDERRQLDWYRSILFGRAETLRLIGEREPGIARLQEAIPAYQGLLDLYGPTTADLRKPVEEKLERTQAEIRARTARA